MTREDVRAALAAKDPRYAKLFGLPHAAAGGAKPAAAKPRPLPCARLGDALTGPEQEALGLPRTRRYSLCLHEDKPLGDAVCGCMKPVGCGPKCPGYLAANLQQPHPS